MRGGKAMDRTMARDHERATRLARPRAAF